MKRYKLFAVYYDEMRDDYETTRHIECEEHPEGEWVKYEDVKFELELAKSTKSMVEICKEEREMGNGPCGACSWCVRRQEERVEKAEDEIIHLKKELKILKEDNFEQFLLWRNIEPGTQCSKCDGRGVVVYGDTACNNGIGGQIITSGICNKCHGTGKEK